MIARRTTALAERSLSSGALLERGDELDRN